MSQSTLGRIWNRLANRYEQDIDAECCGAIIDEVSTESTKADSEDYCE